jgi:hypothetical protein
MEDGLENIEAKTEEGPKPKKKKEADNTMEFVSSLYSTSCCRFHNFHCHAQLFGTATSL